MIRAHLFMVLLVGVAALGNDGMVEPGHGSALARPKLSPAALLAPGAVTDLRVSAVTEASAVLTWTEVPTGSSAIARYVVRFMARSPAPFVWGALSDVTTGGCAAPIYGSTAAGGRTRSCVLGGLAPKTGYDVQLVAYTGVLNSTAVFGPFSNIATVVTAERIGPLLVLRDRTNPQDTVEFFTASLPFDFGDRRYPIHGRFPVGDRIAYFYDVRDSLVARGYFVLARP